MALKTSTLWLIIGAFIMFNIAQVGTIQHLINHLTDVDFSATTAATAVSFTGLGSTVGKFLFGSLSDRIPARYCVVISFSLCLAATIILLSVVSTSSLVILLTYALIMGFGIGGWTPLEAILTSQNFGLIHYGAISGVVPLFYNISTGVGPTVFGYIYDVTQGYYWALILSLALYIVATVSIVALLRPKRRAE